MSKRFKTAAVLGAGAWGTALAQTLARGGLSVTLWAHEPATARDINERHENPLFLRDMPLEASIYATPLMPEAVAEKDLLVWATPAQHLRATLADSEITRPEGAPILIASKGVEEMSGLLMSEIAMQIAPENPVAVLSGPTFAREVAEGKPTAVTLACSDAALGAELAATCAVPAFRIYRSDDVTGAQIGGAVKNVVALACGIVEGRGLGDNARAALMTRGLAEMVRLGLAKGGRAETLMGLSGLGDLALTCNNDQSRNMRLGIAVGGGMSRIDAMEHPDLGLRHSVVEGVDGAISVGQLAARLGVDMPICRVVAAILHEGADVEATIAALLARPLKDE
ncbi:MAG: NAD(P)H-dependent glycerol-3-phosphate dehydrogenase [Alphaproteobacteria bacterium]|nr:NAD(P)H-dependent glycerol-3-phosphate dehydrogenase [Alphaproteobacteria bacterium]